MADSLRGGIELASWIAGIVMIPITIVLALRKPDIPSGTRPIPPAPPEPVLSEKEHISNDAAPPTVQGTSEIRLVQSSSLSVDALPRGLRLIEYVPDEVLHIGTAKSSPPWSLSRIIGFFLYWFFGLLLAVSIAGPQLDGQIFGGFIYTLVFVAVLWPLATARFRLGPSVRIRIDRTEVWVILPFGCYGGGWPPSPAERQIFDAARKEYELQIFVYGICIWIERSRNERDNYKGTRNFRAALYDISNIPAKPRRFTWLNPWR